MGPLATALLALDFVPVLGTHETCGRERHIVSRGAAKKCDYNNGVVVVYDEVGAPWVASIANVTVRNMRILAREHRLADGAYVPYSNDGGHFADGRHVPSVSAPS